MQCKSNTNQSTDTLELLVTFMERHIKGVTEILLTKSYKKNEV